MGGQRVVVTGAAGFIGSSVVDRLLADGHTVVGIDCFEDYYARGLKEANLLGALACDRYRHLDGNLLELDLEPVVRGADCVYHLAAQAGVRASWGSSFETYVLNNVLATQRVLEACASAGAAKLVYASSSSVYGDQDSLPLRETMTPRPRSPYGVTKLAGEHLCMLYAEDRGLDVTALRFFTVYGPRQRPDMAFHKFIRAMLEERPIVIYGSGDQTRDFTYVDDIVEGIVAAPGAPSGAVMNLGGGHRVGLLDAVNLIGEIVGVDPALDIRASEAGDVRHTWADVTSAEDSIGFCPRVALEEGLRREVAWIEGTTWR